MKHKLQFQYGIKAFSFFSSSWEMPTVTSNFMESSLKSSCIEEAKWNTEIYQFEPQILRPFQLSVADLALKTELSPARLCRAKREGSKTVHSSQSHCKKQRI